MGILRADRITGLGGANAIKGSTFLGTFGSATYGNQIEIQKDAELDIGNGNLTVECWFNSPLTSGYQSILGQEFYNNFTSNKISFNFYLNSDGIYLWNRENGSASQKFGVTGLWVASTWNHVAWVREGTGSDENKIYLNGSLVGSAFTNDVTYSSEQKYHIGGNFYSQVAFGQYPFSGHISNLRMSNIARYTANFTPPTSEFAVDSNTILLTCQSPSNILKEETGKILSHNTRENNTPAQASRFTPNSPVGFSTTTDVGSQFGSNFDGFTVFATSTYMVPPGGNTAERNRGRGLVMGGGRTTPSSAGINNITFIEIHSQGNAQDFGDLTEDDVIIGGSLASSTRGIRAGGFDPSPGTNSNTIDFVTIANTANATDFGDLIQASHWMQSGGSQTRGVMAGGNGGGNVIQYITIATAGNSQDFGDLINSYTTTVGSGNGAASPTRLLFAGGTLHPSPSATNIIQYVTIASTGDAVDFGDLTDNKTRFGVCSSATRGLYGGGGPAETDRTNTITFVTLASTGNSVDFGDRIVASNNVAATSNATRGVFIGGGDPSATVNTIDFITIATSGTATDFGDNVTLIEHTSACSDSHGGIS